MIQVTLGTNTQRKKITVDGKETPKNILENNDIDYGTASIHLDGSSLTVQEMNTPLEELGVTEKCILIAVIKTDNAR